MDLDRLKELIRMFEASALAEIEIEEEGRRVRLMKPHQGAAYSSHPVAPPPKSPAHGGPPSPSPSDSDMEVAGDSVLSTIKSPMVGTFYSAPAPDEAPYVAPGDTVDENQVVCLVEAMKLKNEVTAPFPAVIEEVLVQNGEPVEFGQPLFVVRPIV